jgi:hypothetical protein
LPAPLPPAAFLSTQDVAILIFYDLEGEGSAPDLDEAFYDLPQPPQLEEDVVDEAFYDLYADLPLSAPLRCMVYDGCPLLGAPRRRSDGGETSRQRGSRHMIDWQMRMTRSR